MPKSAKPLVILGSHLTKAEKSKRKKAEKSLKISDNLVYKPPKQLSTKEEKELYLSIVKELKASGILTNLDIEILIQTVNSIVKMREADKSIKKYGLVVEKDDGSLQKNPACNVYKDFQKIFYQCCLQLGLSPSARAKLAVINANDKENKDDPVLKVLRGSDGI